MGLRVYIGYDNREQDAYDVAARTAKAYGCEVCPLYEDRLRRSGMLTRTMDRRGGMWDFNSSAPQSTEFAISRFFVPLLAHSGLALFVDCDVVFLDDPHMLIDYIDEDAAVSVVKHPPMEVGGLKMDQQIQTNYHRKLWSSVMLFNLDHPGNRRVTLDMLNNWPGRDLHAFGWLADNEITSLPPESNWLVGLQPKPEHPIIAHYTLGTPNMPGHEQSEYADLWHSFASER